MYKPSTNALPKARTPYPGGSEREDAGKTVSHERMRLELTDASGRYIQSTRVRDEMTARAGTDGHGMDGRGAPTRVIYERPDGTMTLATKGCLFITVHRRDYSVEELTLLHRHQLHFAFERRSSFAVLTILDVDENHIVRLSKPAREATLELARSMTPHIRCSSVVFDREGFAASAIRSLVTTVHLFSKAPFPSQVSSDLRGAIQWLGLKLGKQRPSDFDCAAIAASVTDLRHPPTAV